MARCSEQSQEITDPTEKAKKFKTSREQEPERENKI